MAASVARVHGDRPGFGNRWRMGDEGRRSGEEGRWVWRRDEEGRTHSEAQRSEPGTTGGEGRDFPFVSRQKVWGERTVGHRFRFGPNRTMDTTVRILRFFFYKIGMPIFLGISFS